MFYKELYTQYYIRNSVLGLTKFPFHLRSQTKDVNKINKSVIIINGLDPDKMDSFSSSKHKIILWWSDCLNGE